jgi:hypothetical protein
LLRLLKLSHRQIQSGKAGRLHLEIVRENTGEIIWETTRGDLLVQLDDSVDQADLVGLLAERRLAEIQYQRAVRLIQDKSISRSDYDEAQAKLQNAQAQADSKQAG